MGIVTLISLGLAIVSALLAVAIDRRWPDISRRRLILAASLPVPVLIFVLGTATAFAILLVPGSAPPETDAGGMAFVVITMITGMTSFGALLASLLVNLIVCHVLRSR